MNEDRLLLRIAIEQALAQLPEERDRVMVALYYQLDHPKDYNGPWPPTFASVAEYVGCRFDGGPLAESTIRYRMRIVLERMRIEGWLKL